MFAIVIRHTSWAYRKSQNFNFVFERVARYFSRSFSLYFFFFFFSLFFLSFFPHLSIIYSPSSVGKGSRHTIPVDFHLLSLLLLPICRLNSPDPPPESGCLATSLISVHFSFSFSPSFPPSFPPPSFPYPSASIPPFQQSPNEPTHPSSYCQLHPFCTRK